jgi:hypothetical protein
MKKFTLLMVVAALFSTTAIAQENRFSIGAELAMPMGDFADFAGFGFGASLRYEMPLGENLGVMATAGYLTFGKEELDLGPFFGKFSYQYSMIPIQLGLKYYFMDAQDGFYGALQTGVHLFSAKVEIETPSYTDPLTGLVIPGLSLSSTESSTEFGVAPGIGYHLENVDIGLRYQLLFTEGTSTSYLGVRLAYVFGER